MRPEQLLVCDVDFLQKVNDMYKAQTGEDWYKTDDNGDIIERMFMKDTVSGLCIANYPKIFNKYETLEQSEKDQIDASLGDYSDKIKNLNEVNFPLEE